MPYDATIHSGRLRRLGPAFYRGRAYVHWSMTVEGRRTGWLDAGLHAQMRECLCHALVRYELLCPAYCFMPDHAHFLFVGWSEGSDQRRAVRMVRQGWNALLEPQGFHLQRQGFDHVLREQERQHGAFAGVAHYIFANPVRAGLTEDWRDYPYLGAMAPGYSNLDPRGADYWERFWKIHSLHLQRAGNLADESLTASATSADSE